MRNTVVSSKNIDFAKLIGKYLYTEDISSYLVDYIKTRRWFRRKSEIIKKIVFRDYAILNNEPLQLLTIIEIFYKNFHSEVYYFPVAAEISTNLSLDKEAIFTINFNGMTIILYDAFVDISFCANLLKLIKQHKQVKSLQGVFSFYPTEVLSKIKSSFPDDKIKLISTEQSNTSINYNNSLIMKNFRNIEYGLNPDFEITHFLTKEAHLKNVPALMGYIEYQNEDKMTATAAVLQEYITNKGDCWNYTLIKIEETLRTAMRNVLIKEDKDVRSAIKDFSYSFIQEMYRLGEITGYFHEALTKSQDDEAFIAELINEDDIQHWHSDMTNSINGILDKISSNLNNYNKEVRDKVSIIIKNKEILIKIIDNLYLLRQCSQKKIRIHGDYHLGQVLKTQNDFVILDFEGEPIKTMEERRSKFLPQKDIAGMLRSFNYATCTCLYELPDVSEEEQANLKKWATIWEELIIEAFLEGYLKVMSINLPCKDAFLKILQAYQIDKAIYELDYEINNRPDWLKIPVEYLRSVVE